MVFGGLGGIRRHVEGIQEAFEGFWGVFGGFRRDLGGPGGFWEAWEHGFDWISKILWVRGTVEDSGARKFAINMATCGARLDALKEEMVQGEGKGRCLNLDASRRS